MEHAMPIRLLAIAFLLLGSLAAPAQTPWKAGAGKVVITPDRPMWMSGYGSRTKPAEGTASELYAKALMLETAAGERALLVTFDLVGIDRDTSQALIQAIRDKHPMPRERIILSVSHTHCGPVVGRNLRAMYFLDATQAKRVDDYTDGLPTLVLKAVDQAAKNLAPARIESGKGYATFATNRRNNKEKEVPALREAGKLLGPVDHDVPVLSVRDAEGKLQAVVFGYACHATTLDFYQWSGDWPGYAQAEIESAHPGVVALFWAGCGADQNPIPRRTQSLAQSYGKELAQAVESVLRAPMKPVAASLKARYEEIPLPLSELPTREKLAEEMRDPNKFIASRAKLLLEEWKTKGELPQSYPYPLQAWQLGDELTLLTMGGEVVVDYSLRFKKEIGDIWTMAYANDVMAYIPSARVLKEGGYEGATSMIYYGLPTTWSPRIEDLIVDASKRLVGEVRK
jgi:neutral ceramidase